jgi:predicted PurR-regulated permease PerM
MADRRERTASAVSKAFAIIAAGVAVVWALYLARDALLIIYISVLLAIGFGPLVHAIEHQQIVPIGQRLPRWLAILVVYLAIVGVMTIVALLVIPPAVAQMQDIWTRLPGWLDRAQEFLMSRGLLNHRITLEEAVRSTPASPGNAVGTVAMAFRTIVASVFAFITTLILTFYLLIESGSLFAGFARLFPPADRPRVVQASREVSTKVSAWLSGQLILAGAIGVSSAVGLYLLGVPYFYVLALVTAVGETIPVIGPLLSAVPAALAGLAVSPATALFVLLFFLVQQQIESHLLVPKVMARQVGVTAVTVLVALLIGGSVLGVLGALLAVPTAAILQVVLQELLDERDRLAERRMLTDLPKAVNR